MSTKEIEIVEGVLVETRTDKYEYFYQTHEEMVKYVMSKISYNASWVINFEMANQEILAFKPTSGNSFGLTNYKFQRLQR